MEITPSDTLKKLAFFLWTTHPNQLPSPNLSKKNYINLRYITWWIDMCIYCEMVATIKLANMSLPHILTFCACVRWEHLRTTLNKFQGSSTALLNRVALQYVTSSEVTQLVSESWYPLTNLSLFPWPWRSPFHSLFSWV